MIVISIAEYGSETAVEILGHAEYAACGQDIVCAGVSALTMALDAFAEDGTVQVGDGYYYAVFDAKNAQAVEMFVAGAKAVEELYPDCVEVNR